MPRFAVILCTVLCICLGIKAAAQPLSNVRQKKIPVRSTALVLDSLSIVPGSFTIKNTSPGSFLLDEVNATLLWKQLPATDSVAVFYRVFPYRLNAKANRYRFDSIANNFINNPTVGAVRKKPGGSNNLIDFGNLSYSGSFGRSLSFGNAQDAVVNSVFNLQINGLLGDGIEIAAAITDNNIPVQPDGTTQQLNEFDRIWLQFKKKPWEVNLGDIDIRQKPAYFLNFYKRLQGISFSTETKITKNINNKVLASGAIAKGKFTRNIFQGQEGNQGPYRLTGANSELFFVILANTERVFIDGIQMQRGEDQDYVINYNTAEITFTPRQMITKDKRIQIEFEYTDRNYLNALLYLNDEVEIGKKLKLNIGMYSNTDAKNSTINQSLDTLQRQFLNDIGDDIQNAFYPAAVRDTFSISRILYIAKDTLENGITYRIYQYKAEKDTAMYTLTFSEVGFGRGDYIPSFNAANGKVYQWVAPVNGVKQGNFAPVTRLVTPKKQQLMSLGITYQLTDKTRISTEFGFSRYDVNTFSNKQKNNDDAGAQKLLVNDERSLYIFKRKIQLSTVAGYERVHERFKPLERLRTVEFLRDWGLPYETGIATEQLPSLSVQLNDNKNTSLQYAYTGYLRSDGYKGHRNVINLSQQIKGWELRSLVSITNFDAGTFNGYFFRPRVELNKVLAKLRNYNIGGSFYLEHSETKAKISDTITPGSFSFRDWTAYVRSDATKLNRWSLQYVSRANQAPQGKIFTPLDINHNFTALVELLKSRKHQFRINGTYRILRIKNQLLTSQQPEKSLIGRAEYALNLMKGALTGNVLYELGAGQEQRRDFSYIEVPAGQGEYTWIDYNNDGVPQLNEFEVAQFPDQAKFIRVFTPTNQFVKASYNTFNYSVQFSPWIIWNKSTDNWRKFGSRFNIQSSLQSNRKQINAGRFNFDPFKGNVEDTTLISLYTIVSNTLSFNRSSPVWGADISNNRNVSKAILTYGFETRRLLDWSLRLRWNIGRKWTTELVGKKGTNDLVTPNPKFGNRNYNIDLLSIEPKISFTKGSVFRTAVSFKYDDKQGATLAGEQDCSISSGTVEAKYNVVQNSVLTGKFTYSNIHFTGASNTTIAYIMLDALQPGRNLLWNLELTKRLANSLEINFQYEGRKAGDTRPVHIGRASLRAIF